MTSYHLTMDGSKPWTVTGDLLREVGGEQYVKLRPHDHGLIRLVTQGHCECPQAKLRRSLGGCAGYRALVKLRNDFIMNLEDAKDGNAAAAAALLGKPDSGVKYKKKGVVPQLPGLNASQLQTLRDLPEVIDVPVPCGADGAMVDVGPPIMVSMIRACHPCDELCVRFDAASIESVVQFMRCHGVSMDELIQKRQYGHHGHDKGVWRNGSAGLITKVDPDAEPNADDAMPSKRYSLC